MQTWSCPGQQTGAQRRKRSSPPCSACSPGKLVAAAALAGGSEPRSSKPKRSATQPSTGGAAWHLGPRAVPLYLPMLPGRLELIRWPTTAASAFVFSGFPFLYL